MKENNDPVSDDLTARDVIARKVMLTAVADATDAAATGYISTGEMVDAVLAALAAAGYTIVTTDDWEWGWQKPWRGSTVENPERRADAERIVATANERGWEGWNVVRRVPERPAGPWEVAPDVDA